MCSNPTNLTSNSPFFNLILAILSMNGSSVSAQEQHWTVDVSNSVAKIQPTMYGIFFEDINFGADGGLYPELVKNRSFEFDNPLMGWNQPNSNRYEFNDHSGSAAILRSSENNTNRNFCRVTVNNNQEYELLNEGFRGMGVKKDARYHLSLQAAKRAGDVKKITFQLVDTSGQILGETAISPTSSDWTPYSAQLTATKRKPTHN